MLAAMPHITNTGAAQAAIPPNATPKMHALVLTKPICHSLDCTRPHNVATLSGLTAQHTTQIMSYVLNFVRGIWCQQNL
jgi:hypothetical protein